VNVRPLPFLYHHKYYFHCRLLSLLVIDECVDRCVSVKFSAVVVAVVVVDKHCLLYHSVSANGDSDVLTLLYLSTIHNPYVDCFVNGTLRVTV
jgi:hypothetical protein